jgi:hypothetical protein
MIRLSSLKIKNFPSRAVVDHITAELPGGKKTRVHVARYLRSRVRPRLVVFSDPTPLLRWCKSNGVANAINGGFSLHHNKSLLGEVWIKGSKHDSVEFTQPWHNQRGSVHISYKGRIKIAPRYYLPGEPKGDLLQAGPLLVHKGQSLITPDGDPEGISVSSDQFDDDWTGDRRFPRAAIGSNEDFIFCVTTDGYSMPDKQPENAGLTLSEAAEIMINLGAIEALNLDGGSSATLIANGKLINRPQAGIKDNYKTYPEGRPIPNAIVFEPLTKHPSLI